MNKNAIAAIVLAVAASSSMDAQPVLSAAAPTVVRKVLMQHDVPSTNQTTTMVAVEIPVGGREGRHTHPGPVIVHVEEGAITLDYEGKPTMTYKAGDTFLVEAGKVHEGINNGNVSARALASFVTTKGQPLTAQVQ